MQSWIQTYINEENEGQRLKLLNEALKTSSPNLDNEVILNSSEDNQEIKQGIPFHLAQDLLYLNLNNTEKSKILDLISSTNKIELEYFLIHGLKYWDQNFASLALQKWAKETDHLLWFKVLNLAASPLSPQRIKYTILDNLQDIPGAPLLTAITNSPSIKEYSSAFHAILLQRAIQWDFYAPILDEIAMLRVFDFNNTPFPENKAFLLALSWISKYKPEVLVQLSSDTSIAQSIRNLFELILVNLENNDLQTQLDISENKIGKNWPPLWSRNKLDENILSGELKKIFHPNLIKPALDQEEWDVFTGIDKKTFIKSITQIENPLSFISALLSLNGFMTYPPDAAIITKLDQLYKNQLISEDLIALLPMRIQLELYLQEHTKHKYQFLLEMENRSLSGDGVDIAKNLLLQNIETSAENEELERNIFFDLMYRQDLSAQEVPAKYLNLSNKPSLWSLLIKNWIQPDVRDLSQMSTLARKSQNIFLPCYIRTLSRFKNEDASVLKLLDYVRSTDQFILKEVINALGEIDSHKAISELLHLITRPNIDETNKLEISSLLQKKDLSKHQNELRSTIHDISNSSNLVLQEIQDVLLGLLIADQVKTESSANTDDLSLDSVLIDAIPHYQKLSGEVKRSLRTAEFFTQTSKDYQVNNIELSPIIDMQYKSLELIFREVFEESTKKLINTGILQHKLDILGYARPVVKAMNEFENSIASLDIICDIPFFSKFKLRKMLRSLCMYRPGKRFTLDGIKAFSLFFICFSRKNCPYGLSDLFPLNFADDHQLALYCRDLHIFQDVRNRAVHEGFSPDKHHNIEQIWKDTARIIDATILLKPGIKDSF